ncbi:MAG: hypothetical protein ACXV5R_05415 [Candidatus Angelobacter sp.]
MLIHVQNLLSELQKNKLTELRQRPSWAIAPGTCPMSAAFGQLLPWLAFLE